jgi:hypothetical protein
MRLVFAAIVLASLGIAAVWMFAHRSEHSLSADAAALEPLFQRVVVAPGDDPSSFPVAITGASLIEIDRTGALIVHVGDRVTRQPSPRAYQDTGGGRRDVSVRFDIAPAGEPRFVIGLYDHAFPLVIEP